MESNARFVLGVFVEAPQAESLVFFFQRALVEAEHIGVAVPRAQVEQMGPDRRSWPGP